MHYTILGKENQNTYLFQILQRCLPRSLSRCINTLADKKQRQLSEIAFVYTLTCQTLFQITVLTVIILSCVMMVSYKLCKVEKHTEPVRILRSCTDNSVEGTLLQASIQQLPILCYLSNASGEVVLSQSFYDLCAKELQQHFYLSPQRRSSISEVDTPALLYLQKC